MLLSKWMQQRKMFVHRQGIVIQMTMLDFGFHTNNAMLTVHRTIIILVVAESSPGSMQLCTQFVA